MNERTGNGSLKPETVDSGRNKNCIAYTLNRSWLGCWVNMARRGLRLKIEIPDISDFTSAVSFRETSINRCDPTRAKKEFAENVLLNMQKINFNEFDGWLQREEFTENLKFTILNLERVVKSSKNNLICRINRFYGTQERDENNKNTIYLMKNSSIISSSYMDGQYSTTAPKNLNKKLAILCRTSFKINIEYRLAGEADDEATMFIFAQKRQLFSMVKNSREFIQNPIWRQNLYFYWQIESALRTTENAIARASLTRIYVIVSEITVDVGQVKSPLLARSHLQVCRISRRSRETFVCGDDDWRL